MTVGSVQLRCLPAAHPCSGVSGTRRPVNVCSCRSGRQASPPSEARQQCPANRREALFNLMAIAATLQPAVAWAGDLRYGSWDGKSAADGSCAIGDEGIDCRKQLLGRNKLDISSYGTSASPRPEAGTAVAADMSDEYVRSTLQVAEVIEQYASLDPFSPDRPGIVKTLKADGSNWASKYARGGNTRKSSARRFYIAYDALLGHLVTSGMAPMPRTKLDKVLENVQEARTLLADGK